MTGRHPVSVKSALLIEQILCCVLDLVRNILCLILDAVCGILDRIGNILSDVLSSLGSILCGFLHFIRDLDLVAAHTAVFAEAIIIIVKFICIIAAASFVLTTLCDHNRNSGTGGGSGKQCKSSHCFHSHSSFSARCISI